MKWSWGVFSLLVITFIISVSLSFINLFMKPFPYPMLLFLIVLFSTVIIILLQSDYKKQEIQFATNEGTWSVIPGVHTKKLKSGLWVARGGGYHLTGIMGGDDSTIIYDDELVLKKGKVYCTTACFKWSWSLLTNEEKRELEEFGCAKFPIYRITHNSIISTDNLVGFDQVEETNTITAIERLSQIVNIQASFLKLQGMRIDDFNNSSNFIWESSSRVKDAEKIDIAVKKQLEDRQKILERETKGED